MFTYQWRDFYEDGNYEIHDTLTKKIIGESRARQLARSVTAVAYLVPQEASQSHCTATTIMAHVEQTNEHDRKQDDIGDQ